MLINIFIFTLWVKLIHGFIGYDCGSDILNITTLSTIDVEPCDIPEENVQLTPQYIQLLQINDYTETTVLQCKIEIQRTIFYCGFWSTNSMVSGGYGEYIREIGHNDCAKIHRSRSLRLSNDRILDGLNVNGTTRRSLTFAGYVNSEGKCNGVGYSDPYGSWYNVIVTGFIRVTLQQYTARVSLENDQIHLKSGVVCKVSDGSCLDMEGGPTFWQPIPTDRCAFGQYSILYEGLAQKMIDQQDNDTQVIYSLNTRDMTFALASKAKESVCGYTVTRTEHPKLVIFETVRGQTFAYNDKVSIDNLDIFTYTNSKFVYVEKHIKNQIKRLYRDIVEQRCNLERQTLKNSLSIATQSPDEFAYDLMKGPGYMAVVSGEVVHVIKCIPVEVAVKHNDDICFSELPVTRNNQTYYLTPRTHILKSHGTQVPCNRVIPSYYNVGNQWIKLLPTPTGAVKPLSLKPMTKLVWQYDNIKDFATSGVYTEKDIKNIKDRIMFPVERNSLLNTVAREMHGLPVSDEDKTIFKLMNEDTVTRLAESAWERTWKKFMSFGTFSAGIIAIMMIIHIFKIVIDIVIRGYTLHAVFGWSIHLLGALWSSIAHFLLYAAQKAQDAQPSYQSGNQDVELGLYPHLPKENVPVQQEHPTAPPASVGHTVSQPSYSLIPKEP